MRAAVVISSKARMVKLNAKPEPVEIDLAKSAVVVVDMQNAFAS